MPRHGPQQEPLTYLDKGILTPPHPSFVMAKKFFIKNDTFVKIVENWKKCRFSGQVYPCSGMAFELEFHL